MRIEPAKVSDVEAIVTLFSQAAVWLTTQGIEQWPIEPPTHFWSFLRRKIREGDVFVARAENGRLLAHIRFEYKASKIWPDDPTQTAYIRGLVIANEVRGQGVGVTMLDWARAYVSAQGCKRLRLDCLARNGRLCQYYSEHGFTFVGEGHSGDYTAALFEMMLTGGD
jgi:GNAT superfamily N-acetyltransferase